MDLVISLIIYLSSFGISILTSVIYQTLYKKNNYRGIHYWKKLLWFIAIISVPVLISAVRYDVGTDYFNYIRIFDRINSWKFGTAWARYGKEPLFFLLVKFGYFLFKDAWGVFFLSSLIIHIFIIAGLDSFKKGIYISFGLFIYYLFTFNNGLNIVRQIIAMSIVFFSIRYVYYRKLIPFVIFIIVATLFHNTAIVCVVFYFCTINTNNFFLKKIYNTLFYLLIIFTPVILIIPIKLLLNFNILSNYSNYLESTQILLKVGFLIHILPILIPIFWFKNNILKNNKNYESIINMTLLNVPFQYLAYYMNWGSRIAFYSNSIYFIAIPLLISSFKNRNNKILITVYYVLYFLYWYIRRYVISNSGGAFPYKTIF